MKSTVTKKSYILTIIFCMVLLAVCGVGSYFLGISNARGESTKQYLLTEDVEPGHSLKGKYREEFVPNNASVDMNSLVINSNDIDTKVATSKMYKNSPITVTDLTVLEDLERVVEVAIPITVEGSIANSIKEGDMVAVKLTYTEGKQEDPVVISRIKVKSVKTTNGTPVIDESTVAGYAIFDTTNLESSDIKNALKEGSLYCVKYNDLSKKPLEKTYQGPTGTTSSVIEEGTAEKPAVAPSN